MSRVNKMILEIMVEKFDMFDIMFSATIKMAGRRAKERCAWYMRHIDTFPTNKIGDLEYCIGRIPLNLKPSFTDSG